MPTVNVALIGYAFMGRAHSNAWRQVVPFLSPRLTPRLRVICGRSARKVEAARRQWGWDETATDWQAVVSRPDVDVVDICTPGDSHAPIAVAAARAGKAVFCEKPLANSVKEAEAMLAAVEKAGVTHMICHNYRRVPAVLLASQIISSGQIGDVRHFRGTYLQDWITDPKFPLVWRLDRRKAGSGALGDIGAHVVDLARFLVGEIAEVAGDLRTFVPKRPLPGAPGRRGTVTVDDAAHGAGPKELQPVRDKRQQGQRGLQPRAYERARGVLRIRPAGPARIPHDSRDRGRPSVRQGLVATRPHHRLRAHVHAHGL
jgi:predicted dehydrogenase